MQKYLYFFTIRYRIQNFEYFRIIPTKPLRGHYKTTTPSNRHNIISSKLPRTILNCETSNFTTLTKPDSIPPTKKKQTMENKNSLSPSNIRQEFRLAEDKWSVSDPFLYIFVCPDTIVISADFIQSLKSDRNKWTENRPFCGTIFYFRRVVWKIWNATTSGPFGIDGEAYRVMKWISVNIVIKRLFITFLLNN